MKGCLIFLTGLILYATAAYGVLAGGRPNTVSGGNNAFAGVVNPANAVWIPDRFDVSVLWIHQKSSLHNKDDNPLFPPGKTDTTYKARNLYTADFAIHKQFKLKLGSRLFDSSLSLAVYTVPTLVKLRTKDPIPGAGTTPIEVRNKIDVISAIFSLKLNPCHSIGVSLDYYYFSHLRNGFENADNPLRSVSPGHVTNNGTDHSDGVGLSAGYRWNITKRLDFGAAWVKKSYCGQFRRYRGYEPHHAENFIPQTAAAGFNYKFTTRLAGRIEVLWSNLGNVPNSNNNVLSDGSINLNKRGSRNSPGPGLQNATFINVGAGYKVNEILALGLGFSHRIRLPISSNFLSHSYTRQTIYDVLSFGANFKYKKHDVYLVFTHGFRNRVSGFMPEQVGGGGHFVGEKQNNTLSISWGYLY